LSKAIVTAPIPVSSLAFSPMPSAIMNTGEQQTLIAVALPSTASDKSVVWSSSDATIVSVSAGIVTALKVGTVIITATSVLNPSVSKSLTIVVSNVVSATLIQTISLTVGWNLISFNVVPTDKSIESVFKGILAQVVEIKTQDSFWLATQITAFNSLKTIADGGAYLVKMNNPGTLSIVGIPVETRLIAPQNAGWNLTGCPYQTTTPFSTIFNATNCEMIKDFDGFWIPNANLNSINTFETGNGYFLKKTQ
jgi:hypothetical protein